MTYTYLRRSRILLHSTSASPHTGAKIRRFRLGTIRMVQGWFLVPTDSGQELFVSVPGCPRYMSLPRPSLDLR